MFCFAFSSNRSFVSADGMHEDEEELDSPRDHHDDGWSDDEDKTDTERSMVPSDRAAAAVVLPVPGWCCSGCGSLYEGEFQACGLCSAERPRFWCCACGLAVSQREAVPTAEALNRSAALRSRMIGYLAQWSGAENTWLGDLVRAQTDMERGHTPSMFDVDDQNSSRLDVYCAQCARSVDRLELVVCECCHNIVCRGCVGSYRAYGGRVRLCLGRCMDIVLRWPSSGGLGVEEKGGDSKALDDKKNQEGGKEDRAPTGRDGNGDCLMRVLCHGCQSISFLEQSMFREADTVPDTAAAMRGRALTVALLDEGNDCAAPLAERVPLAWKRAEPHVLAAEGRRRLAAVPFDRSRLGPWFARAVAVGHVELSRLLFTLGVNPHQLTPLGAEPEPKRRKHSLSPGSGAAAAAFRPTLWDACWSLQPAVGRALVYESVFYPWLLLLGCARRTAGASPAAASLEARVLHLLIVFLAPRRELRSRRQS